jgi:XTP/dITP diphosphohydrolase
MSGGTLLVATRSPDKLREIRQILGRDAPVGRVVSLHDQGVEEVAAEHSIEAFATFHENAIAKARYFAERSGMTTLAEDSGLCVDALDGAPGVRSKRFSGRFDLSGAALDAENTRLLLELLSGVPADRRAAQYVCVVALLLLLDGSVRTFRGTCPGVILEEPRGTNGFGYDPVFRPAGQTTSFGELPQTLKNQLSHRAQALRSARPAILAALDRPLQSQ